MQIGLVGLQYSGKTTLFNTLAKIDQDPMQSVKEEATIEVVKVPDERLDKLSEIFNPKKKVNATIELFDFPGLRMGDDGKVKITTTFLNNVKNNDALFFVIRQFQNDAVMHPMNSVDPLRDVKFLEEEFMFYDLSFLENRIEKLKKEVMKVNKPEVKHELALIESCFAHVESEKPLRTMDLHPEDLKRLSGYQLLTLKPVAVAINFDDSSMDEVDKVIEEIKSGVQDKDICVIPFFAQIELELSQMEDEDQAAFMEDYGITESALTKILRTSYELLGLQSFLTVGEDECRAWTIRKGYTAPEAAGVIHSDFYNKFIKADVVHYDDFMVHKSLSKCRDAGVRRLEGKEYIVKDGDIMDIRHG